MSDNFSSTPSSKARQGARSRNSLVELGERAEKGDVLGRVSDLFGDVIHEVKALEAGIPLLITTSPAVAADGLLMILTREDAE